MIAVIDIGGTQIKYGVIDETVERLIMLGKLDTQADEVEFDMLSRLNIVLGKITKLYRLNGIAISTAGTVNPKTGEIIYANENIPNYMGTRLKEELETTYKVPCEVENDVNCALLGEIHFGERGTVDSALMMTIGTGVGGAIYLNQGIYHGYSFSAGEIGYSSLNQNNIESRISTSALVRRIQAEYPDVNVNGYWIFEQAKTGSEFINQILDEFIDELGQVIINFVSVLNPEMVILGGGIMEQQEFLSKKIEKKFSEYPNKFVLEKTRLTFASLGNNAGMLGAYYHFKESQKKTMNK